MKFQSKNVIVIIGNGFDLAHGLPTGYGDFANDIIEKIAIELLDRKFNGDMESDLIKGEFIKEYIDATGRGVYAFPKNEIKELVGILNENKDSFSNKMKNKFLADLYKNQHLNWFDIENSYFESLLEIKSNGLSNVEKKDRLITLNKEFEQIKQLLKEYLKTIETLRDSRISAFFEHYFDTTVLENIYVLNFNYTDTVNEYFSLLYRNAYKKINHIHGDLHGDIIFGYGNDQSVDYEELRDSGIDEYLTYFKTFSYGMNESYMEVVNTIETLNSYEVVNLGHSLGQTDKTLLQEIFNSDHCQKIYLTKRNDLEGVKQEDAFRTTYFAASRIISDDKRLRKVVVNYRDSVTFP